MKVEASSIIISLGWLFLLTWLVLQNTQVAEATDNENGLYSPHDDVLSLDHKTFHRAVENKENIVWVVEFYNRWCGHCIRFASEWKKVATKMKGWKDLVPIAAIDCSQDSNLESCNSFDFESYPTMLMLSPRLNSTSNKQVVQTVRYRAEFYIIGSIIDFMTEYTPPSGPRLKPLLKMEDIWSEKKPQHKFIVFIFEEAESKLGRKVILDMHLYQNILVRSMLKESVVKFGVTKFPSLYQIKDDSTFRLLAVGKEEPGDQELFVKSLQKLIKEEGGQLDGEHDKGKDSLVIVVTPKDIVKMAIGQPFHSQNKSRRVSMQDLESALRYMLRQEIAMSKKIEGEKFKALQKFVQVLLKYFPGRHHIMKFLQSVSVMLSLVNTGHLSGMQWRSKIEHLQNSTMFLPGVIKWDSCEGSEPRYRGYPCSMWTLFHVLTVSALTQQGHSPRSVNPQEVPLAIRGYMQHFFGCSECVKNFLDMAVTMERDIKDNKGAVLWFWSAHNKVNKRLKGDETEDKIFPKVQFPPASLCPKCHSSEETNDSQPIWNTELVLKFLISFYTEKSIYISPELAKGDASGRSVKDKGRTISRGSELKVDIGLKESGSKVKMANKHLSEMGHRVGVSWPSNSTLIGNSFYAYRASGKGAGLVFNNLDLSMCAVFYVVSTTLILGLYYHFVIRRNVTPCPKRCCR